MDKNNCRLVIEWEGQLNEEDQILSGSDIASIVSFLKLMGKTKEIRFKAFYGAEDNCAPQIKLRAVKSHGVIIPTHLTVEFEEDGIDKFLHIDQRERN